MKQALILVDEINEIKKTDGRRDFNFFKAKIHAVKLDGHTAELGLSGKRGAEQ